MAKQLLGFVICIIVLLTNTSALAEGLTEYYYNGQWHAYHSGPTFLQVNGERIETDVPPMIFKDRSVVPARAVFEKLGAAVAWNGKKAQVGVSMDDTEILLAIESTTAVVNGQQYAMEIPAKIINDRTMIPTRFVGETLGMEVGWQGDQSLITIDYAAKDDEAQEDIRINAIEYKAGKSGVRIVIESDGAIEDYSSFELEEPSRLVVDIENAILNVEDKSVDIKHDQVSKVRAAQFEKNPHITRFVVDLKEWTGYHIDLSEDKTRLYINFSSEPGSVTDIEFSKTKDCNIVDIKTDFVQKPNVFRLSNPDRIVVDIPSSQLDMREKKVNIKENIVKSIRYSQFDENMTRVVVDVGGQPQFELQEMSDGIRLELTDAPYKNLYYSNSEGPKLMIYDNMADSDYKESIEMNDNRYTISVPMSDVDLGTGRLYINDNHFYYIDIIQDGATETTDLVFRSKNPYSYVVQPEKNSDKTTIQVQAANPEDMEPDDPSKDDEPEIDLTIDPKAKNKIVVIDAGHGGRDPGAIYQGVNEKDLNLDISLRLYRMLKDAGIRVYMTRMNDTFVELGDRAKYANNLNASLFVSIHNNAMHDPNYDGSMTLYYPSSFNPAYGISGAELARIIQDEMVRYLGTANKGLRKRPNLAVLNKTKMPAVIAEIAFMSNHGDMQNLKKDSFRQKSAESLYAGIIKALNKSVK